MDIRQAVEHGGTPAGKWQEPNHKNVVVSVILFIFAVRNQQKYKCVHVQSISMTV